MKRTIPILALFFAVLAALWLWSGSGTQRLEKPPGAGQAPEPWVSDPWQVPPHHGFIRPVLERYLGELPRGARVLDLGCGNGLMLGNLRDRGWELHGLDIDRNAIEAAREKFPFATFYVGDATADLTPILGPEPFDAVISIEVIEHVFDPQTFADNLYGLLEPGGFAVVTTPYHGYLKNLLIAASGRVPQHFDPLALYGHIKFFARDSLAEVLWRAGFEDLEFTGVGRAPYLWKDMVMKAGRPPSQASAAPRALNRAGRGSGAAGAGTPS